MPPNYACNHYYPLDNFSDREGNTTNFVKTSQVLWVYFKIKWTKRKYFIPTDILINQHSFTTYNVERNIYFDYDELSLFLIVR